MNNRSKIDDPCRRLPWTLPGALLIWAMALWGVAFFIKEPSPRPVEPPPIDARLIEQPAPTPVQKVKLGQPNAPTKSTLAPAVPVKPAPAPVRKPRPKPITHQVQRREPFRPAREVSGHAHPMPQEVSGNAHASPNPAAAGAVQAGSLNGNSASGSMDANSGARAIIKPMPQIPDDLRGEAFSTSVLARFHVAADGSATVELTKPTPNLRLNSIVLSSLKKWRFMPAIKNGGPVASIQEILIKIEVK